jgi:predicted glycosyltransferase
LYRLGTRNPQIAVGFFWDIIGVFYEEITVYGQPDIGDIEAA